jgi:hypothetical protein
MTDYKSLYDEMMNEVRGRTYDGAVHHKHHVEPKVLRPDLEHDKTNLVFLTPAEHWKAHYYLWKSDPTNKKLENALWFMTFSSWAYKYSASWTFEEEREFVDNHSNLVLALRDYRPTKATNPKTGESVFVSRPEEVPEGFVILAPVCSVRDKSNEKNPMYGRKHTEESKTRQHETIKERTASLDVYRSNGRKWYHDPVTGHEKLFAEHEVTLGYVLGRHELTRTVLDNHGDWNKKKVTCVETNETFGSVKEAVEKYGREVRKCIRDGITHEGLHFVAERPLKGMFASKELEVSSTHNRGRIVVYDADGNRKFVHPSEACNYKKKNDSTNRTILRWVHTSSKRKQVRQEELEEYLSKGWVLGKGSAKDVTHIFTKFVSS